jgi:hypothetical protein
MNAHHLLRNSCLVLLASAAWGASAQVGRQWSRPADTPILVWPNGQSVPVVPVIPVVPVYPAPNNYEGLRLGGYPSDRNLNLGDRTPNLGGPMSGSTSSAPGAFRTPGYPAPQPIAPGMVERYRRD